MGPAGSAPVPRRGRASGAFVMPPDTSTAGAAEAANEPAPVLAGFLEGLLGLQEQSVGAGSASAVKDRDARRHGQALLSVLGELQSVLLGSADPAATLRSVSERLASLTDGIPVAADPTLRAVVAAIALRARVELARRQT